MPMINLIVIQSLDESEKVKSGEEVFQSCKDNCILSTDSYIVLPNNKSVFLIALSTAIDKCISSEEDWIIHIDAHSYNQAEDQSFSGGVSIAGQDLDNELSWENLHSVLSRLSEKIKGKVVLSLAMCYSQDFLPLIKKCPIAAIDSIITTTVKIESKPLILGFNAFYQKYSKCHEIKKAFEYGMQRFVIESDQCMFKLAQANMLTLQQGTTLQSGKYIIKQVLGQGGFGITYLAENTMLEGKVAIKEFFFKEYCSRDEETSHVSISIEGNKEIVKRFKQKFIKEARTIFKLNHPNIVRIHDIFEENGTAYYVMDYIEGESLGEMVNRRGSIPETEAIGYIKEVGAALEYIHGKSINHLDIKPSNIMRRQEDGQILVIDFGVAKQYDAETAEGTTTTPVGISHGYSPTEQYRINGVQTFSPQSDVYALAATLFKLLTGVTPPEADEVRDEGLPLGELRAKGVSESVISAIVNATKSRRERIQSIGLWLDILNGIKSAEEETELIIGINPNLKNYSEEEISTFLNFKSLSETTILEGEQLDDKLPLLRFAAENGNPIAQIKLGFCYEIGEGVEENNAEAINWFLKAAEQNNSYIQWYLGDKYYFDKDFDRAFFWYRKSAEQDNDEAQERLGRCYYSGEGVKQDFELARKWYIKAAKQGNTFAQLMLGDMYYNGTGVDQDYAQAVSWYLMAANVGITEAQYKLGDCYANGYGVEQNKEQAEYWYKKSGYVNEKDVMLAKRRKSLLEKIILMNTGNVIVDLFIFSIYLLGGIYLLLYLFLK